MFTLRGLNFAARLESRIQHSATPFGGLLSYRSTPNIYCAVNATKLRRQLSFCSTRQMPSSSILDSLLQCNGDRWMTRRQLFCTSMPRLDLASNEEKLRKAEAAIKKEHTVPICSILFDCLSKNKSPISGLDVVALLHRLHLPEYILQKVDSVPPNAGVAVLAFLLYKIVSPLRYATTLILIKLSFPLLRRFGLLTAKEVKYKMRLKYTNKVKRIKRRYQQKYGRSNSNETRRRFSNGEGKK